MSSLGWYWHRLRAMNAAEISGRVEKKTKSILDWWRLPDWNKAHVESGRSFPKLPNKSDAPAEVAAALHKEVEEILAGKWVAFSHIPLQVDVPPRWHCDYLAKKDVATIESAFALNHRQLPGGADIKVIWELSRWNQLVRLAQGAWLLEHAKALTMCIDLLKDWTDHNPPFRGWNWTSPLEPGMRLIQFSWIDALIEAAAAKAGRGEELERLRSSILPPHVWMTWRYKSFGSSANNHLLGELTGLIVALARWPSLERWAAPMRKLQQLWEREVLAQFAPDGGNREQGLNYHLFAFEFLWQGRLALQSAGAEISTEVEERIGLAAKFLTEVQDVDDPWDYGDSDSAFVTPLFIDQRKVSAEWIQWIENSASSPALRFWLGPFSNPGATRNGYEIAGGWRVFPESGIGVQRVKDWMLRWDLSPLGYLATAAHGHLDALHLSIWFKGKAFIIDPGTGAYYGDAELRNELASWQAHNGPRVVGKELSRRLGPFLWDEHHSQPQWNSDDGLLVGRQSVQGDEVKRTIRLLRDGEGWIVEDCGGNDEVIAVTWQFAPGTAIETHSPGLFRAERGGVVVWVQVEEGSILDDKEMKAVKTSPSFRRIEPAPCLRLQSRAHKPCLLRTAFLVSKPS